MPIVAYCTQCGVGLGPGFAFCPECGQAVVAPPVRGGPAPAAPLAPPAPPTRTGAVTRAGRGEASWEAAEQSPWEGYGVDAAWPAPTGGAVTPGTDPGGADPAGFGRRLAGRLIDGLVLAAIEVAALLLSYAIVVRPALDKATTDEAGITAAFSALVLYLLWPLLGIVPTFLYFAWSEARGQTIGKRAAGIRVESLEGTPLGGSHAFRRTACNFASGLLLGIGQLAMLWDRRRRTWPDRWSSSRVVRVSPQAEPFPSAGAAPLASFAVLIVAIMFGLPALVQHSDDSTSSTARSDGFGTVGTTQRRNSSSSASNTTISAPAGGATTSVTTAGASVNPCDLVTPTEIRSALGVGVQAGELGSSEPKRLPDGRAIQSRGRQKCTFSTVTDAVTPKLYQTPAFLVFTEQYTTEAGATSAFANFRDIARAQVLADTAPFGPVGDATANRGFGEQLGVGSESLVYWSIARWSASDPTVVFPTTVDPNGPTPVSRSEIGFFGLEFRVGTTCVVVALPGRFGNPADYPAIQRDAVPRLRQLGEVVAGRLRSHS